MCLAPTMPGTVRAAAAHGGFGRFEEASCAEHIVGWIRPQPHSQPPVLAYAQREQLCVEAWALPFSPQGSSRRVWCVLLFTPAFQSRKQSQRASGSGLRSPSQRVWAARHTRLLRLQALPSLCHTPPSPATSHSGLPSDGLLADLTIILPCGRGACYHSLLHFVAS